MHTRLFDVRDPAGSIAHMLADLDLTPHGPAAATGAFRRVPTSFHGRTPR